MSEVVKIAVECTYVQGEMKERKGEECGSKGTERCPLTGETVDQLPLETSGTLFTRIRKPALCYVTL
jgi:hypothetical protein